MAGLIFLGIFVFSALIALSAFIFGHDVDHDVGHDGGDSGGGMPSIFSLRVISIFLVGFSGIGMVATYAWRLPPGASTFCGIGFGLILAAIAYGIITLFHRQQASSIVAPDAYAGLEGRITGAIPPGGTGEVTVTVNGQLRTIFASTADGSAVAEGRAVKVLHVSGGAAVVEPLQK